MGSVLGQLQGSGSRPLLPALTLLVVSSIISARQSPSVLVLYEDCGGVGSVATGLATNSSSNSSSSLLLALPCGTASLPANQLHAAASSDSPPVVVVIGTCDVISVVASALVGNRSVLREEEVVPPASLVLVPTLTTRCHGQAVPRWTCSPALEPFQRLLDLTVSWMTYHSWSKTAVLYDQSLDIKANIHLVKRFLAANIRLGTRLSFREIPPQEATSEASRRELETLLETVLDPWEEEEARHVVVMADEPTVTRLLSIISGRESKDDDSDCDWLIFTSVTDDFIAAVTPTTGHRIYFVNSTLHMGLRSRGLEAMRTAEALARDPSTCRNTPKVEPVTVYVKPQDYSSLLKPPVVLGAAAHPTLVPVYKWTPSPQPSAYWRTGSLRALPFNQLYQLHGSHLYVATLRSEPFIKPLYETSGDLVRNSNSSRRRSLPPHITCQQPRAFVGFLVDMLDLLKSQMNFTYTLYEVCDKSYGSLKNGRWTGVVGEVIYAHAHIGLANLGANYARSHAVSFPRVSTSYGGAGIIMKRPQSTAKDLLTVFLLPFSVNVWVCIVVFVPVVAFAMHLATLPHRRLRQVLKRCPGLRPTRSPAGAINARTPVRITITRPSAGSRSSEESIRWYPSPRPPLRSTQLQRYQKEYTASHTGQDNVSDKRRTNNSTELVLKTDEEKEDAAQSFLSGLWFAATVLLQQGQEQVPETSPGRLVFGTMWVAAVVLYAAYTSNLVSYFTVTKISLPFHNLEGLVKSNYKFGTRQGSVYLDNMMSSGTDVFKAAAAKLESFGEGVEMPTYEEAIKRTLQGSYAFIGDYVVLDYYQSKDCDLVLLKQQLFETMSSFVLPHHSSLLPAVNYHMSLMSERGILEKLRQRWWRAHPCPDAATVTAYQSIGLPEVCSALLVMVAGVVMSVVVGCLEHRLRLLHDAKKTTPPSHYADNDAKKTTPPSHYAENDVKKTTPLSHYAENDVKKTTPPSHYAENDVKKTTPPSHYSDNDVKKTKPFSHYAENDVKKTTPFSHYAENDVKKTTPLSHYAENDVKKTTPFSHYADYGVKKTTPPSHYTDYDVQKTTPPSHYTDNDAKDTCNTHSSLHLHQRSLASQIRRSSFSLDLQKQMII